MSKKKPTEAELQRLLDDPVDHPIEVQSDGSLKVDRRKKRVGVQRPLTYRQAIASSY